MPSRISGACTPCRSKKQKCSGHHPTCSQCSNSAISCTWPEQRKRGPAKGYIEGLESRLHCAESLLLALLPLVSDNIIDTASDAVQHDDEDEMDGFGGRRSSPPLLNKKTGLDYWESFPLDTRRNIRKWQYDCEVNSNPTQHRSNSNSNSQLTALNINASRGSQRSPTHSPVSGGIPSPHGSMSAMSSHNGFMQPMQQQQAMYLAPNHHHMQTGAAQQLLNLSNQSRDQWMAQQHQQHHDESMQHDPILMQQQHARSMHQQHIYTGNIQDGLFW